MSSSEHRADGSATSNGAVLGVDTHPDFRVAVGLDHPGRRLGEAKAPTTASGYRSLVSWAEGFGPVRCAGVEGTGSHGAGLARYPSTAMGIAVVEVERPKRRHLRRRDKSDPRDAEAAARGVLAGGAAGVPKSGDGCVEMIRTLRSARRPAVKARVQAANLPQAMLVTAPEELRRRLRDLPTKELVAARFRPGGDPEDVEEATRFALRSVARRHEALSGEIAELDAQLKRPVAQADPGLVSLPGVGTRHAATPLVLTGDDPEQTSA